MTDDSNGDFSGGLQQGYELGSLTDGLVAYFPFDGSIEDKALSHSVTDNTSADCVSGKVGSEAKDFDGNDDYVDTSYEANFGTGSFTISSWINVGTTSGSTDAIAGNWDGSNGWFVANQDGSPRFYLNGTNLTAGSLNEGTWYHVVWITDESTARIFIDGVQVGSTAKSANVSSSNLMNIGDRGDTVPSFDGKIDDLRIYDRALSRPEIEALYNRTSTQKVTDKDRLTSGLVGHWPLNEEGDGKAYDLSGKSNDSTSVTGTSTAVGLGGAKARKFDGSSYIDTGVKPLAGRSEATMSVFVVFDAFDSQNGVFLARGSSWSNYHGISYDTNGGRVTAGVSNGGASASIDDDVSNYSAGAWYHLAFTFDSGTVKLYRNGTEVGTDTTGPSSLSTNASNLQFGRADGAGRYHNGLIADGRAYGRVLTKSEIQELAKQGGL